MIPERRPQTCFSLVRRSICNPFRLNEPRATGNGQRSLGGYASGPKENLGGTFWQQRRAAGNWQWATESWRLASGAKEVFGVLFGSNDDPPGNRQLATESWRLSKWRERKLWGTFWQQRRAAGNGQWAMGNRALEAKQIARKKILGYFFAGNGQRATGNGHQATGKWQRATGNGQLATATGNWQPATGNGNRQLATGNWQRES